MVVEVTDCITEMLLDIGLGGARNGADIDVDVDDVRDGVGLLPTVNNVGREGGVREGMTRAG